MFDIERKSDWFWKCRRGGAVVSNKLIASNTVYAGNPAKCVSSEIFFSKDIVHSWTEIETKKFDRMDTEQWIYKKTKDTKSMLSIDLLLRQQSNSADRLDVVKECLVADTNKNRFFIGQNSKITKYFKLWDKNSL